MDLTYISTEEEVNKRKNITRMLFRGTYWNYPITDPYLTILENKRRKIKDTNMSMQQCRIKRIFSKTKQITNSNSTREKVKYRVDWGTGLRDIRPISVDDIMKYLNNDQELFDSLMCDDDPPKYDNGLKKYNN